VGINWMYQSNAHSTPLPSNFKAGLFQDRQQPLLSHHGAEQSVRDIQQLRSKHQSMEWSGVCGGELVFGTSSHQSKVQGRGKHKYHTRQQLLSTADTRVSKRVCQSGWHACVKDVLVCVMCVMCVVCVVCVMCVMCVV